MARKKACTVFQGSARQLLAAVDAWRVDARLKADRAFTPRGEESQQGTEVGHHMLQRHTREASAHMPDERLQIVRGHARHTTRVRVGVDEAEEFRTSRRYTP
jgi:hypothetical protein